MTPPSRGVFGVKARADDDMLTQARVGGTARSAAAHDQRHTKDTLIARGKPLASDRQRANTARWCTVREHGRARGQNPVFKSGLIFCPFCAV